MKYNRILSIIKLLKSFLTIRTLQSELMIVIVISALLPAVIINLFYYYKMNSFIEQKVMNYNTEIFERLGKNLDFLLTQVENTKKVAIAITIQSELFSKHDLKLPEERVGFVINNEKLLTNIRRSFVAMSDIYLIGSEGNFFSTNKNCNFEALREKTWIKQVKSSLNEKMTIPTHKVDYYYFNNSDTWVISFIQSFSSVTDSNNGLVQVDINYEEIEKIMKSVNISEKGFVFITNDNYKVLYFPERQYLGNDIGEIVYKGFNLQSVCNISGWERIGNFIVINYSVEETGWKIIGVIPVEDLLVDLKEIKNIFKIIVIMMIILSFLVSYLFSRGITRPIAKLINVIKKVGEGNLDLTVPSAKNMDLQELSTNFNTMIGKINLLLKNIIEKEREKTNAEIEALQAQINPHFLHNTLNTIKWLALMGKSELTAVSVVHLNKILEFTYKSSRKFIAIPEEIKFIESYLYIQMIKYGNDVNVKYHMDDDLNDYCMLKFTLQPIVENAIIHGLAGKKYSGLITIRGIVKDEYLLFEIEDNGVGMSIDKKDKFTGMGISNVDTRIKLNHGEQYGLYITSSPGTGTKVSIKLPKLCNKEV